MQRHAVAVAVCFVIGGVLAPVVLVEPVKVTEEDAHSIGVVEYVGSLRLGFSRSQANRNLPTSPAG
jgi:hypothetical protein